MDKKITCVLLERSQVKDKKYTAVLQNKDGNKIKTVNFGQKGMSDYTIHKDE
jgi:hypothetical protein